MYPTTSGKKFRQFRKLYDRATMTHPPYNQSLAVVLGRLHCAACKFNIFNKASSIKSHVNSDDHKTKLIAWFAGLLKWWQTNGGTFKQWAIAARIVFALSPNSASCERVFSLLKQMFGDQQISTLADAIRAALMLRYNDRVVG